MNAIARNALCTKTHAVLKRYEKPASFGIIKGSRAICKRYVMQSGWRTYERNAKQMPKARKMLSDINAPYMQSLMRLIETQSKITLANWCIDYANKHILPIYESAYPADTRPVDALSAARRWLNGEIKLPEAKAAILECHAAAREAENTPAAQAAARTIGQAAATIHAPTHSIGLALYGALAIAYDRAGINEKWDVYERIAAGECAKMEAALRAVAVENEQNPAKINWNC